MTPSITPTPLPVARAKRDTALYEGPGTGYSENGWLAQGQTADIISRLKGDYWWYVENAYGVRGWVEIGSITIEYDVENVPMVTPLPYQAPPAATGKPPTAAPPEASGDPLELPTVNPFEVACDTFTLKIWVEARGGTGVYTYLVNDEIVAQDIAGGFSMDLRTGGGTWIGVFSVISGGQRADREMAFMRSQHCN